ncbi:tryptophanase [bacterium]|nr:tryptophanase [bacterium]
MILPEPYRIKMVEPIRLTSYRERERLIRQAGYNLFQIPADAVFIDLLTDSGTGAMSSNQWAAIMQGDESYAGASSFYHLQSTVEDLFGFPCLLPTHQGRAAEHVFFSTFVHPGDMIPSNAHFDTTRANLEWLDANPIDLPADCANDPARDCSFKGNMNTDMLIEILEQYREKVPFVMLTVTNNRAAGSPVSMGNVKKVSEICHEYGKPLIIDACRHAENAFFIQQRDPEYTKNGIEWITSKFFSFADGMLMSAKKDGLCNIGGFIAVKNRTTFERLKSALILMEGFNTYGGLAGRDLNAMAVGLREAVQEDYLAHRIGQVQFLADELEKREIPIYKPVGGHAVFVDARRFFTNDRFELPGQSLAVALYLEGGIRSCDIGSGMFSNTDETIPGAGLHLELLRLAIPRRTYTESHLRYVADVFAHLNLQKAQIPYLRCTHMPEFLGHFQAKFELAL